jgi:DNA transformation protein
VATSHEYLHYVLEQLAGLTGVSSRRMFGGTGLYCDGSFFALISGDTLYFKVDDANRAVYEARGMGRFRPYAERPQLSMAYYEVPADILEEPESLVEWARASVTAAIRAANAPRKKSAKPGIRRVLDKRNSRRR